VALKGNSKQVISGANFWSGVGLFVAAVCFWIAYVQEVPALGTGFGLVAVVILIGAGAGFVGAYSVARTLYIICGIFTLPLGALLLFGSRAMREAVNLPFLLAAEQATFEDASRTLPAPLSNMTVAKPTTPLPESRAVAAKRPCPSCGKSIMVGATTCGYCWSKVGQ
jgi:hypothetical protein